MGDMFRLSVSHHQALFLIKIQILDLFLKCAMGSHTLTGFIVVYITLITVTVLLL